MLRELVSHYGEPFGDSSAIPTWYVSRLARSHVPMVLSGDGGDEAFGGYDSYEMWMQPESAARAVGMARAAPRAALRMLRRVLRQAIARREVHDLAQWQHLISYMDERPRRSLWKEPYHYLLRQSCAVFSDAARDARRFDRLAFAQYLDYQTYLPCDILTKVDVASMYHGLEVRTPLVDVQVVEMAAQIPLQMRFGRDNSGRIVRKHLLKRILSHHLPDDIVHRRKQGFALPRAQWFLEGQPARKLLEEVLLDPASKLRVWFNADSIRTLISTHGQPHDNSGRLWLLLVLGLWTEQNAEVQFSS
jgi:asparagine synthase (glutamine-hydrolysing)